MSILKQIKELRGQIQDCKIEGEQDNSKDIERALDILMDIENDVETIESANSDIDTAQRTIEHLV